MRLPRKPQYVLVKLDSDMIEWPSDECVLVYHYFGPKKLRAGERVCVNDGHFKNVFGTVLRRAWFWKGYSYGVRRVRRKSVTVTVPVEKTMEYEVA